MSRRSTEDIVAQAAAEMIDRAKREWPPIDDADANCEMFDEQETIIDEYLAAVENRSTDLPDRQQLAWGCYTILGFVGEVTRADVQFLSRVYASSIGISMFQIAPKIRDIKERVIRAQERFAAKSNQPISSIPDDDLPF